MDMRPESEESKINSEYKLRIKAPKKILHFSDGTLEEYSSSEEDMIIEEQHKINPKSLAWGAWIWYQSTLIGSNSLKVCDYLGESLASFFGITTPKFQFEIEEYNRMKKEEQEQKEQEELQMGGWIGSNSNEPTTIPPKNEYLPE